MKFIPNSDIKEEMLKEIGLKDIDDLFSDISNEILIKELDLDNGLSQIDTTQKLREISGKNKSFHELTCFTGGGMKPHYVPSIVKSLISRAEFFTAYTPYQSEASQGFLQAMFEYQSMIAELTGMDVANCSLYDGVTALSESALMCSRIKRKNVFVIPENISFEKKSVLKNYCKGPGIKIKEVKYDRKTGQIDINDLEKKVDEEVCGVYVENPNFFGIFEEKINEIDDIIKNSDSLLVAGVDPISLGVVKSPGEYGADIVIGEGSCFGNNVDFGGSTLGLFACKKKYLRQMPGRIIGLTSDEDGKKAFCMALQTREQHIRRGRATSNICTNEGLCALAACIHLSWLGGNGLNKLAKMNFEKAHDFFDKICEVDGFEPLFDASFFNEFVIKSKKDPNKINQKLLKKNIQGGIVLDNIFSDLNNSMLLGATELHTDMDIDRFIKLIKEV